MSATPTRTFRQRARRLLRTSLTLLFWYCISSAIILTTKWLFTNHFPFPLTVTTFSNTLTTVWAVLFSFRPRWRPEPLTKKQFREYVLPIGFATALEIGCSNLALQMLTVSFGTILKGGAPVFTMMWGLLLGIESFSANVCLSLVTIAMGIALAAFGEGNTFVVAGFILQLLATALGGLRWAMTHVLLKGSRDHRMSPLTATLYTSPTTALCVLPFALAFEGVTVKDKMGQLGDNEFWIIFGTMMFVGTLVFILLISEYWLVNATSSLALSVAGVFKELLTIGGGIVFFRDHMSLLNIVGFGICQVGIGAYAYLRYDPNEPSESGEIPATELPLTYGIVSDDDELDTELEEEQMTDTTSVAVGPQW